LKTWIIVIKIFISLGLLAYLAIRAVQEQQFQILFSGDRNWSWFGLAIVSSLTAHVISYYRWYLLARALELPMSLGETIRVSFVSGFFGLFAFGVIGTDSIRAFSAARRSPNKRIEAVASVFVDRLIGVTTMFLFAAIGFYIHDRSRWEHLERTGAQAIEFVCGSAGILAILAIGGTVCLFLVPQLRRYRWFNRLLHLPLIGKLLVRLIGVMMLYRRQPFVLVVGLGLSVCSHLLFAITIYAIARCISVEHPTLADHYIIAPISLVANCIPLPGGLGGMETMLDFLYRAFSDPHAKNQIGVVVAFAFRFVLLVVSAIGAVIWFSMNRAERQSIQQADKDSTPD
jgi:uncharacterized protein (TIRG00374 family)